MGTGRFYTNYGTAAGQGLVKVGTTAEIVAGLLLDTYTPDYVGHKLWSDISASEATGTGYTPGGTALTAIGGSGIPSIPTVAANSYGVPWSSALAVGAQMVIRTSAGNGSLYEAVAGGTTGGSEPSWNTAYHSITADNGISWLNVGTAMTHLLGAIPMLTLTIANFRYVPIWSKTSGALICLHDLGSKQTFGTSTAWTFTADASGIARQFWQ